MPYQIILGSKTPDDAVEFREVGKESQIIKMDDLSKIAKKRGQTITQMSLAWVLRHPTMTSALIGARNVNQLNECLDSLNNLNFTNSELKLIDKFATEEKINLWAPSSKN